MPSSLAHSARKAAFKRGERIKRSRTVQPLMGIDTCRVLGGVNGRNRCLVNRSTYPTLASHAMSAQGLSFEEMVYTKLLHKRSTEGVWASESFMAPPNREVAFHACVVRNMRAKLCALSWGGPLAMDLRPPPSALC